MNKDLPIYKYKDKIQSLVLDNQVVIISSETGSGKSTQIPQYLYEFGYNVIITEPRRIATTSVAKRVANEMDVKLGRLVGYKTGYERCDSNETEILYITDGLQLIREIFDYDDLMENKILVIDEVHEWNLNIETILAWIHKKLQEGFKTKVVLMSATMDCKKLSKYFFNAPILEIPGNLYKVKFNQVPSSRIFDITISLVKEGKNTLVFSVGKNEILDFIYRLNKRLKKDNLSAVVLPFFAELSFYSQQLVFKNYDFPKVIVSTNVAQTSITIPEIDAVVDQGQEKRFEVINGIEGLNIKNVSKADIIQRKGRAGRVKEGVYYLCNDTPYKLFKEFSVPEINRYFLDQVILKLKSSGIDIIEDNLEFFHLPNKEDLEEGVKLLKNLGCIDKNNNITNDGIEISKIPLSVRNAVIALNAKKYNILMDGIIASVIIEVRGISDYKDKPKYFGNETSDIIFEVKLYKKIRESIKKNIYNDDTFKGVNKNVYYKVTEMIDKVLYSFEGEPLGECKTDEDYNNLKLCIIAGFFDSIYKLSGYEYFNVCKEDEYRLLDTTSCISSLNPKFLIGIPKDICVTRGYKYKKNLKIITLCTKVTFEEIQKILPDMCFVEEKSVNGFWVVKKYFNHELMEQKNIKI